jgi:hypothetical protein
MSWQASTTDSGNLQNAVYSRRATTCLASWQWRRSPALSS